MHGTSATDVKKLTKAIRSGTAKPEAVKSHVGNYLKNLSKGMLSEGFWEENSQSAIQEYEERWARGHADQEIIFEATHNMLNNAKNFVYTLSPFHQGARPGSPEDEAGSAIFLGALLGGGSSLYGAYREKAAEKLLDKNITDQWNSLKKLNETTKNLFVQNVAAPFKQEQSEELKLQLDDQGNPVWDNFRWYNILAKGLANKTFLEENFAATVATSPEWDTYNRKMAMAAYAYQMMEMGLSIEDLTDLLEYDSAFNGTTAEQLGVGDALQVNKEMILEAAKTYETSRQSMEKLTEVDADTLQFNHMMHRNAYYLNLKKQYLSQLEANEEQAQFGINDMIDDIDAKLKAMKDNRQQFREAYDFEVAPHKVISKKIKALEEDLKANKITQEEHDKTKEELNYTLGQLIDTGGLHAVSIGKDYTSFASDSFSADEARLVHNNKGQTRVSGQTFIHWKMGRDRMWEEQVKDMIDDDTIKDEEILRTIIQEDISTSDFVDDYLTTTQDNAAAKSIENQARRDYLEKLDRMLSLDEQQAEDIIRGVMPVYNFQQQWTPPFVDEQGNPRGVEDVRNDIASELVKLDEDDQQTSVESFLVEIAKKSIQDTALIVDYIKSLRNADADALSKFKDFMFAQFAENYAVASGVSVLRTVEAAPEEFVAEGEAAKALKQVQVAKRIFSDPEKAPGSKRLHKTMLKGSSYVVHTKGTQEVNINEIFKISDRAGLVKGLEGLEQRLKDAIKLAKENKANRQVHQRRTAEEFSRRHREVLELEGSPMRQAFEKAYGVDKTNEIISSLQDAGDDAYIGQFMALLGVNEHHTKAELELIIAKLEALQEGVTSKMSARAEAKVPLNPYVYHNVTKNAAYILGYLLDAQHLFTQDEMSELPYYRLHTSQDLVRFIDELSRAREQDENGLSFYVGLSVEQSALLDSYVNDLFVLMGMQETVNMLRSKMNPIQALTAYSSYTDTLYNETSLSPTVQQSIAVWQAMATVTSRSFSDDLNFVTVLKGVLGSGKTSMGAKIVVDMIQNLGLATKDEIISFGHNKHSSQQIYESLFGDAQGATTLEDFMNRDSLEGIKLIVIDEAMAFPNDVLDGIIFSSVREWNKANHKTPIHILALGDPAQLTVEDPTATTLGSLSFPSTKDTSPLTVIYRTSVATIADSALRFRWNPNEVPSLSTLASHTQDQLMTLPAMEEVYGVTGGNDVKNQMQALKTMLSKPSSESRAVIVSNEKARQRLAAELPSGTEILTYDEIQSQQRDQIYIYLPYGDGKIDGTPHTSRTAYNAIMYMAIGRAKKFVYIANEDLQVSPIIDEQLAKAKEDLEDDSKANKSDLDAAIAEANKIAVIMTGSSAIQPRTPTRVEPKEETGKPEEELDDYETPEFEDPEENDSGVPVEQAPPPIVPPKETVTMEGDKMSFNHALSSPSSKVRLSTSPANNLPAQVQPGMKTYILVEKRGNNLYYHFVVQNEGRFFSVGVLSKEDSRVSKGMQALYEAVDSTRSIDQTQINTSSLGFDLDENQQTLLQDFNISIEKGQAMQYIYDYSTLDANRTMGSSTPLDDAFQVWQSDFFDKANGMRGAIPLNPPRTTTGKTNFKNYKARVRVFKNIRNDSYNYETPEDIRRRNSSFIPKSGIPYLVINNPRTDQQLATDLQEQYVRLEPRRINQGDSQFKILKAAHTALTRLEAALQVISPDLLYGTSKFNSLILKFSQRYYVEESYDAADVKRRAIAKDPDAIDLMEWLEAYKSTLDLTTLTEEQLNEVVSALDDLIRNHMFAPKYMDFYYSKEDATRLKDDPSTPWTTMKKTSEDSSKYHLFDEDGNISTGWVLSQEKSKLQQTINQIAKVNKRANGINIRVRKYKHNGVSAKFYVTGKSILHTQQAFGEYYAKFGAYLYDLSENILHQLQMRGYPEDMLDAWRQTLVNTNDPTKLAPTEVLEKILLNWAQYFEDNGASTVAQNIRNKISEGKTSYTEQNVVNPLTTSTLAQMLDVNDKGITNLRLPLNTAEINKLGEDLNNPANLAKLNSMLESPLVAVEPNYLEVKVDGLQVPQQQSAPEQTSENIEPEEKYSPMDAGVDYTEQFKSRLNEILNKASAPKYVKTTITTILDRLGTLPLKVVWADQNNNGAIQRSVAANSNPLAITLSYTDRSVIVLNSTKLSTKNQAEIDQVFIHEAIHAVTSKAITHPATEQDELFKAQVEDIYLMFANELAKTGEKVEDYLHSTAHVTAKKLEGEEAKQAYSDFLLKEFIANLAYPPLRQRLSQLEVKGETLIQRIWKAIAEFLGVSNAYSYLQKSFEQLAAQDGQFYTGVQVGAEQTALDETYRTRINKLYSDILELADPEELELAYQEALMGNDEDLVILHQDTLDEGTIDFALAADKNDPLRVGLRYNLTNKQLRELAEEILSPAKLSEFNTKGSAFNMMHIYHRLYVADYTEPGRNLWRTVINDTKDFNRFKTSELQLYAQRQTFSFIKRLYTNILSPLEKRHIVRALKEEFPNQAFNNANDIAEALTNYVLALE